MQKMYSSMDDKIPCIKLAKGGAVTTGAKGVKASSSTLLDKKMKGGGAPKAKPEGKVMEKAKGGAVVEKGKMEVKPKGPVMNKAKGGKVDERLCYGGKS